DFRGALTRLLAFGCPRLADAGKEGFGWFVVRVLWRQFAAEGLGEDGGVEFGQEFGGAGVVGAHAVEPGEGGFDLFNNLGLGWDIKIWYLQRGKLVGVHIVYAACRSRLGLDL